MITCPVCNAHLDLELPNHKAKSCDSLAEAKFALRAIIRSCEKEAEAKFGNRVYANVMTCYVLAKDGLGLNDNLGHNEHANR